ncbi:hypothetical protein CYMTET_46828 [Cymbomonas tetramitiformis]|uniref:Uncharacterized protein n=1 Tax=Cymbomonas tetramitiformis TaxID=36881 RepID=A0AAE0BWS5_9CHLO|nr:hypothetical protein CYMTET_46828 [Cymbomonas tetramitiformis]
MWGDHAIPLLDIPGVDVGVEAPCHVVEVVKWRRFLELAEEALRSAKDLAVFEKEVAEVVRISSGKRRSLASWTSWCEKLGKLRQSGERSDAVRQAIETIAIAATKQVVRTVGELGGAGRVKVSSFERPAQGGASGVEKDGCLKDLEKLLANALSRDPGCEELGLKPRLTPGIIPHQLRTVDSAGRTCVVKPKTATEMKDAAVQMYEDIYAKHPNQRLPSFVVPFVDGAGTRSVRIEEERIDHLLAEAQAGEREFLRLLRIGGPAAGGLVLPMMCIGVAWTKAIAYIINGGADPTPLHLWHYDAGSGCGERVSVPAKGYF